MDRESRETAKQFKKIVEFERSLFPLTLEEAEAEYFADMAFDERLSDILDATTPSILASYRHTTTKHLDGIAGRYFKSNNYIETPVTFEDDSLDEILEIPAFEYTVYGGVSTDEDSLSISATILPEDESLDRISIANTGQKPNTYAITISDRNNIKNFDIINTEDVFAILCQLSDVADSRQIKTHLNELHKDPDYDQSLLSEPIAVLWSEMAETHGEKHSTQYLSHELEEPYDPNNPETVELIYKEIETPDSSQIEFSLIHTTHYSDLGADEAHRLRMVFDFSTEEPLEKEAAKIVHSNGARLVSFTTTKEIKGCITNLDLDLPDIKEMFVDWFDILISASKTN